MTGLALAALFLPLSHFLISSTRLRALLVRGLGERLYSGAYSVLALAAFAWLVVAYRQAPAAAVWAAPRALQLALWPVILLASLLAVAGLTTANPVIARSERLFGRPEVVHGVLRITRNPFFWGGGLFALAHVILIGEVAAMLAFGSIALLGLAGAPLLDAKKARRHGPAWDAFAAATSDIPFLAIAQRRQRLAWREIGLWRLALGIAVFLAALLAHARLFGGDPLAAL